MKKYFYTAIIYILASQGLNLAAQDTPFFRYQLNQTECFTKANYPSLDDATQQLVANLLGYTPCYSNCALEQATACTPKLGNPNVSLSESPSNWCFDGTIEIVWQCQPATGSGNEEEAPEENDAEGAYFIKVSPNPFSDHLTFKIAVENPRYPITLRIIDLEGQVYYEKEHRTNDYILNVDIDLGIAPIGTYYAILEFKGRAVDQAKLELVR